MTRDMDLVRAMLLNVEQSARGLDREALAGAGYSEDAIDYHAALLVEAGLAEGVVSREIGRIIPHATLFRLTWKGHEFVDTVRNPGVWQKTRTKLTGTIGTVSLDVIVELAKYFVKDALGLKTAN